MENLSTASTAALEKLRTPPEAPATGLLRLPMEIRLQIYSYCIPRKRIIAVTFPRFNTQYPFLDRILDFNDVQDWADLGNDLVSEDGVLHLPEVKAEDDVVYGSDSDSEDDVV